MRIQLWQDPKIAEVFQAKVDGKFAALCVLDSDIHSFANSLKRGGGYSQQLKRSLGDRKKIQPWVTNEALDMCDRRRQMKQPEYTSTEAGREYRKVNREVGRKMKAANEEWIEEECETIEKGMLLGNSKEAYNTLKALIKTQQH